MKVLDVRLGSELCHDYNRGRQEGEQGGLELSFVHTEFMGDVSSKTQET